MAKARRTFKRKRTFKRTKKRFIRKRSALPRYDGMVRVKLQASKEMIVRTMPGSGVSNFVVTWGD